MFYEPWGHSDMFGSVITEPFHSEAQLGVFFMDTGGYLNMCGHGMKAFWVPGFVEKYYPSPG
jgi:proline racemase